MTADSWSDEAIERHRAAPDNDGMQPDPHAHDHALPEPTIWPVTMALGVTLLAASLATSLFVAIGGVALCVLALRGWVQELVGETHAEAAASDETTRHGGDHG